MYIDLVQATAERMMHAITVYEMRSTLGTSCSWWTCIQISGPLPLSAQSASNAASNVIISILDHAHNPAS
jgi:hypothetical protein